MPAVPGMIQWALGLIKTRSTRPCAGSRMIAENGYDYLDNISDLGKPVRRGALIANHKG